VRNRDALFSPPEADGRTTSVILRCRPARTSSGEHTDTRERFRRVGFGRPPSDDRERIGASSRVWVLAITGLAGIGRLSLSASICRKEPVVVTPTFRSLSPVELAALRKGRGPSVDLIGYTDFIQSLQVGEGGQLTLDGDEQKRTVKRRLTRAALGRDVRYRRSEGNTIRFELIGS
jgi:hypothetical protein